MQGGNDVEKKPKPNSNRAALFIPHCKPNHEEDEEPHTPRFLFFISFFLT